LREKLEKLKADPFDPQNSKPLKGRNEQRSARVGGLRILFQVQGLDIIVAEIGPRGEFYHTVASASASSQGGHPQRP
jgi:mRNA-degrading endonuclease RelE of RelBE toxin-antitoxin system